ncbi:MAG: GNAT family N-acetyltransferase [Candidatus Limnocylindria bacterium]
MSERRVLLRDITVADADLLDAWTTPEAQGEFNDFGMPRSPAPREALAAGPLRNEHNGQLIVELVADGSAIGTVSWHRVMNGPNPESAAWNMGIALVPEARGRGYGSEAQRQLADYLFETSDANRVEASTDVANLAEQRSLEKAGFTREGVQRGAQFRAGAYHDLVVYSRLRDDPA